MRIAGYFIWLPLVLGLSAEADVYRCRGDFGEPSFRQQPCGQNAAVMTRQAAGPAGRAGGLRPAERAWLEQRRRSATKTRKKKRDRVSSDAAEKAVRTQAHRCRSKRRSLDEVRAKLRRGYKPASGEKLRRRRRAYEDYLATFCS